MRVYLYLFIVFVFVCCQKSTDCRNKSTACAIGFKCSLNDTGKYECLPSKKIINGGNRNEKKARDLIDWIFIKGGKFEMGSNEESDDEKPVHSVTVPSFYMAKTEVTVGQYRKCVEAGKCSKTGVAQTSSNNREYDKYCNWKHSDRENHPINCVNWSQARTFARWAGGDLCSESIWEYTARSGGKNWKYPWGNKSPSKSLAVYSGRSGTAPVCSKTAGNSKQGLCDLSGNIWEWVLDESRNNYNNAPTDGSSVCSTPTCNLSTSNRLYRGGGWYYNWGFLRAADRFHDTPSFRDHDLGFRVCRKYP